MKTLFNKKILQIDDSIFLACFKSFEAMSRFYEKCENASSVVNFRGEPCNWAAFCKNAKYAFKPDGEKLTVTITKNKTKAE